MLSFIAGVSLGLIGILNAIIYGLTDSVRKSVASLCFKEEEIDYEDQISLGRRLSINRDSFLSQDSLIKYGNLAY